MNSAVIPCIFAQAAALDDADFDLPLPASHSPSRTEWDDPLPTLEEISAERDGWMTPLDELLALPSQNGNPDLFLYRERTVALLRRYMRLSVEVGRLPSLLGREFFRAKVTSYHMVTFEDVVIFVHDVEQSLEKLDAIGRELIARIVLQEYTRDETAELLQCSPRTVWRLFPDAIDQLSEIFLAGDILTALPGGHAVRPEFCQDVETEENSVSACEGGKNIF